MYAAPLVKDRGTALRTAVFDVALREGAGGVTISGIARELGISVNTMRRWLRRPEHLPEFGIKHVQYRRRCRLMCPVPSAIAGDEKWRRALNELLRDLPYDQPTLDEHRVWTNLIAGFPDTPWSRTWNDEAMAREAALVHLVVSDLSPMDE